LLSAGVQDPVVYTMDPNTQAERFFTIDGVTGEMFLLEQLYLNQLNSLYTVSHTLITLFCGGRGTKEVDNGLDNINYCSWFK
jgi:hypothetical protein